MYRNVRLPGSSAAVLLIVLGCVGPWLPAAWAAWLPLDGVPGVAGSTEIDALAVHDDGTGEALYAGGFFAVAGELQTRAIARWNGSGWASIGSVEAGGIVRCMTVWNGMLVIGGSFGAVDGVPAANVAAWNGASWTALGAGTGPGNVFALAVYGGDLVATGSFTAAGGVPAARIARWDGIAWSALGSGLADGQGQALTIFEGDLIAGGSFTDAGGAGALRVARWNGSAWSALGGGLSAVVNVLASFDRDGTGPEPPSLIAGGNLFSQANSHLARWDGGTWTAFGGTFSGTGAMAIHCLLVSGDALVVGGLFRTVDGAPGHVRVTRWTPAGGWTPFANGLDPEATSSAEVRGLAELDGDMFAGGRFWNDGRVAMHGIARWDGAAWGALAGGIGGNAAAFVNALAPHAGGLAVGGVFASVGNGVNGNGVALLTGSGWDTLGAGLGEEAESGIAVSALFSRNDSLYAACSGFATTYVNRIAVWDGVAWANLLSLSSANQQPYALAWHAGVLHAGGSFTSIGGVSVNRIAAHDDAGWHALGGGFNATVWALLAFQGDLVAGGQFTQADGAPATRIARWNGSQWSPMGAGLTGTVRALAEHQGSLYAGCSNGVFRWDGANWTSLGTSGAVQALLSTPAGLVAAGGFSAIGGTVASKIARWNGVAWAAFDEGLTGTATGASAVTAALALWDGDLWAGGNHLFAGTNVCPHLARWREGTVAIESEPLIGAHAPGAIMEFSARRLPGGAVRLVARLSERTDAELAVFDAAGRRVETLVRGALEPGRHVWDWGVARGLPSGMYFGRLRVTAAQGIEERAARAIVLR